MLQLTSYCEVLVWHRWCFAGWMQDCDTCSKICFTLKSFLLFQICHNHCHFSWEKRSNNYIFSFSAIIASVCVICERELIVEVLLTWYKVKLASFLWAHIVESVSLHYNVSCIDLWFPTTVEHMTVSLKAKGLVGVSLWSLYLLPKLSLKTHRVNNAT